MPIGTYVHIVSVDHTVHQWQVCAVSVPLGSLVGQSQRTACRRLRLTHPAPYAKPSRLNSAARIIIRRFPRVVRGGFAETVSRGSGMSGYRFALVCLAFAPFAA